VDDYKAQAETVERMFALDSFVDGEEDIELLFGEGQEVFILYAAPARFSDCFDGVAWKGRTDASRDALV
jgi:hypothetical protein